MHLTLEKPSPAFLIKQLYMKKKQLSSFCTKIGKKDQQFYNNCQKKDTDKVGAFTVSDL